MAEVGNVFDHLRAGRGKYMIVADHASNSVPPHLADLGLSRKALGNHIAWDIGTQALAHSLSDALDTEAVISNVSRLVVDKNRRLDQPGLMPDVSDGISIPGNRGLSQADSQARIDAFYHPYHSAITEAVSAKTNPVLISLHSFTPIMDGFQRPWDCGLLYNNDNRLAQQCITHFEGLELCVGDNEPYPGNVYNATMDRHAEAHGHPYIMLEIRNDLLASESAIQQWTARISHLLTQLSHP